MFVYILIMHGRILLVRNKSVLGKRASNKPRKDFAKYLLCFDHDQRIIP
jgi:hypothetical protein